MTREQAIEILWPDCDPEWGKVRLRQTLSKLRYALEPGTPAYSRSVYLTSDRGSVRLATAHVAERDHIWIDALEFERCAETALRLLDSRRDGRAQAHRALQLYRGQFLPLDRYAEWSRAPRQRYQRLWCALVLRLAYVEIAARNLVSAIGLLNALTESAPDDEGVVYLSMVVHAAVGRRAEALRMYHELSVRLRASWGSAPGTELRAIVETIRSGASVEEILAGLPWTAGMDER